MANYKPYDYNQTAMVVINYEEQLQPGTFEHALRHLVDGRLDLSFLDEMYNNDYGGRIAYDPAILLKIILFAYSKGITSSREIEWCCKTNIIFKALSCDTIPHFTTIANFVSSHPDAIEELFSQIVLICDEEGLLGKELFAIDGCKMSSNAAKEHSGTFKELAAKRDKIQRQIKQLMKSQRQMDRYDSLDEDRTKRTAQTLDTLNKAFDRYDQFLKTNSPRIGQGKRPKEVKSNTTDNQSAKMTTSKGTIQGYNGVATVDKKHQIIIDAQAYGEGQEHHTLAPVLETVRERFSRLNIHKDIYKGRHKPIITADTGFANEANMRYLYENKVNAYIPDNQFRQRDPRFAEQKAKYGKRHQDKPKGTKRDVIPAKEFQFDPLSMTCVCPAGETISHRGVRENPIGQTVAYFEGRLLQCRICDLKDKCMQNPASANHGKGSGRQVSFVLNDRRKPTYTDWMKQRVDSAKGKVIYGHRMSVVEPVFANITVQKRLGRFSLRGKKKVDGQWKLYCMVHNIEKLMKNASLAA